MQDRRSFLKAMTAATAGMFVMGCESTTTTASQVPRREVSIGGRRVTVVDIHSHCAVAEVENVILGTNVERAMSENRILGPHRLDLVNERGIDVQVRARTSTGGMRRIVSSPATLSGCRTRGSQTGWPCIPIGLLR